MKIILKKIGMTTLVMVTYIIPLVSWIIFVPSFKLLNFVTKKFGFIPPGRWRWLGIEASDD